MVVFDGFLTAVQFPADRSLPVVPQAMIVCQVLAGQTVCSRHGRLILN